MKIAMMAAAAAVTLGLAGCVEDTGGSSHAGAGANRNVQIVNQTGETVWRFYGSNVGTQYWEEDILGSSVLPSGGSVVIDFYDGTSHCVYDFKIEFRSGRTIEDYGVNVCQVGTYYIR